MSQGNENDAVLQRLAEMDDKISSLSAKSLTTEVAVNLLNQVVRVLRAAQDRCFIQSEDRDRDIMWALLGDKFDKAVACVATDHPVAVDSDDHKFPHGTKRDNTRHPRFVRACEDILGSNIRHLDLGCSGGGLVWDFLSRGHFAIGIEGSDISLLERRAEWRTIPKHLFTADIAKPFIVTSADRKMPLQFNLVTAWEVLEHIPEDSLPILFNNIHGALAPDGIFVASVTTAEDRDPVTGAVWHVTVKPKPWWHEKLSIGGFDVVDGLFQIVDFPRGSGNIRTDDWNAQTSPQTGFHVVCRRRL